MDMVSSAHFSLSAHAVLSVLVTQTCSSQSVSSSDTSAGISDSTWPNLKSGFSFQCHCSPSLASVVSWLWEPEDKVSSLIRFSPSPTSSPSHGISCHLYLQNTFCIGAFLTISISRNPVWAVAVASIWSLLSYLSPYNSFGTQQSNFCEVKI